tara:strand:- start:2139 stop:2282 length:144 start_codon:yes stop_codon:yes gene_type:complete
MSAEQIELNTINFAAVSFSLVNVEGFLTILVLVTALAYNIKRLYGKD